MIWWSILKMLSDEFMLLKLLKNFHNFPTQAHFPLKTPISRNNRYFCFLDMIRIICSKKLWVGLHFLFTSISSIISLHLLFHSNYTIYRHKSNILIFFIFPFPIYLLAVHKVCISWEMDKPNFQVEMCVLFEIFNSRVRIKLLIFGNLGNLYF